MLDKDVTGILDTAKKMAQEKEAFDATHGISKIKADKTSDKNKLIDELDSDGSGDAFSATEQVKE